MEVMTTKHYNVHQRIKYGEDVRKWGEENNHNIIPQIVFYFFHNANGSVKTTGYVAFNNTRSVLRSTKKEAIKAFNETTKKYYK